MGGSWPIAALSDRNRTRLKINLQSITNSPKNRRQVIHARIPRRLQHAVQAFARLGCQRGELLKTHGGIHQVTQNQPDRFGLTIQK